MINRDLNDEQQHWRIQMARGLAAIPDGMHEAIHFWVMYGRQPGDFLTAVLTNDLFGAVRRGDDQNAAALQGWVRLLYNYCPIFCYGSPEKVAAWAAHRGLAGPTEQMAAA